MLKIWVVDVEQLELDLIIETLEKCVLLLFIVADLIGGVPRQLNELVQVLIHHHTPLVRVREFLLLQLEGATGHVVNSKMSLELISDNSLNIGVGVTVSLPPAVIPSSWCATKRNLNTVYISIYASSFATGSCYDRSVTAQLG
jgi:hypothetical protein